MYSQYVSSYPGFWPLPNACSYANICSYQAEHREREERRHHESHEPSSSSKKYKAKEDIKSKWAKLGLFRRQQQV